MLTSLKSKRLVDGLWLLALALYVFAGLPITTFHGDEAMQIYMSHDYATVFIYHNPQQLMSAGPYDVDTDAQLRLINGSVNRYSIGLGWQLAGFTDGDLPPRPGWDWGLDYATNVATLHRPPDALLWASRISSTLFLALSVVVMFAIGWQFGGRSMACLASGLYTLNPVILLNGRRAMMEGSLLFFGLLTILIAIIISRRRAHWGWWPALILASALSVASKHTGAVFVAGAFGWILLAAVLRRDASAMVATITRLFVSGLIALVLFVALSPALWYDPPARFQDLIVEREKLIDIQVQADPHAPTTLLERIQGIITQPFMTAVWHFEAGGWTSFEPISEEIDRYMASPLSGLQFGTVLGGALTLLALAGIISLIRQGRDFRLGIFVWSAFTLAILLVNPLPWQRYFLPLIPIVTLLASEGALRLLRLIVHRPEQETHLSAKTIHPTL